VVCPVDSTGRHRGPYAAQVAGRRRVVNAR
jgi:hypothetical protein